MRIFTLGMIVVAVGFATGCGDKEPVQTESGESADKTAAEAVTPEDVRRETSEAVGAAVTLADQTRVEYINRVQSEIDEFDHRLETLRKKSEAFGVQARETWNDRIAQMAKKQEALQDRLKNVADSSGDAWRELAQGMARSRKEMTEAVQEAEAEFKKPSMDEPEEASPQEEG